MRGKRALDAGGDDAVTACHIGTGIIGEVPGECPTLVSAPALTVADVDDRVREMTREQLVVFWRRRWRRPPPKGISRRLLECNAAWLIQAERQGGVGAATRRRLNELAEVGEGCEQPNDSAKKRVTGAKVSRRPLRAGSRLVRQWQGRTHVVDVVDDGFSYDGRAYSSLTAIAFEITGARWSGPRFFGLNRLKTECGGGRSMKGTPVGAPESSPNPYDSFGEDGPDV